MSDATRSSRGRKPRRGLALLILLLACGAVGYYAWPALSSTGGSAADNSGFLTAVATREPFRLTVRERGTLDSLKSASLTSKVEGSTTIISIVPEGTLVKEGDLLVELDSSALDEKAKQQVIAVTQAEAVLKKATEGLEIQKRQNESDIATADLARQLAELDLTKFIKGEYPQQRNEINGRIQVAKEDLARYKEIYEFSKRLAQKGYKSQNELDADRIAVTKASISLAAVEDELRVLDDFTKARTITELEENKAESARERERVERKGVAALAQYQADVEAAILTLEVEKEKQTRYDAQIVASKIFAPQPGEVVYSTGDSDRRSDGQQIAEGTQVRERQEIIKLPDLTQMKVDTRIHESLISRVSVGLPARVRVDALPGIMLPGTVLSVSSVPVSGSWFRPDLKEYAAVVSLNAMEEPLPLKPGLTAEVEIIVQERADVLQVPFQAVLTVGPTRYIYVLTPTGPVRREVLLGTVNDTHMEILDGVVAGEVVILNPRTHFSEELAALESAQAASNSEENAAASNAAKPQAATAPAATAPADGAKPVADSATRGSGEQRSGARDPAAFFASRDANGDGSLTPDELPGRMAENFKTLDTDGDGKLSPTEFAAAAKAGRPQGTPSGSGN